MEDNTRVLLGLCAKPGMPLHSPLTAGVIKSKGICANEPELCCDKITVGTPEECEAILESGVCDTFPSTPQPSPAPTKIILEI